MPEGLKRALKEAMFRGVNAAFPRPADWAPNCGVVLAYHEVTDPRGFASQMRRLKQLGVTLCGLDQLLDYLSGSTSPAAPFAAVTFDDGYASQLASAVPVLLDERIPATFFVLADRLGGRARWARESREALPVPNERLLAEEDVRRLAELGFEVGSHGSTHASLAEPDVNLQREVADSRRRLQDIVGRKVRAFAYPYGQHTPAAVDAVRRAGYEAAFTVERAAVRPGFDADRRLLVPRVVVEANVAAEGLEAYVTGRALHVWRIRRERGLGKVKELWRAVSKRS